LEDLMMRHLCALAVALVFVAPFTNSADAQSARTVNRRVLGDRAIALELGQAAKRDAEGRFRLDRILRQRDACIEEVVDEKTLCA
jgi:hypothetical protein